LKKISTWLFKEGSMDWFLRNSGGDDSTFMDGEWAGKWELARYRECFATMTTTVVGLVVGHYSLRWIQSFGCKTDKIVHQMEANAVDFFY
jgi:hypothetical protein